MSALRIFLVFSGIALLLAAPAAFLPSAWMATTHRFLLSELLPDQRIVEYLTRTASGLYASLGAITLFLATDVRRYAPVVVVKSVVGVVFGAGVLVIDCVVGMPWYWTAFEGPGVMLICGVGVILGRRVANENRNAKS